MSYVDDDVSNVTGFDPKGWGWGDTEMTDVMGGRGYINPEDYLFGKDFNQIESRYYKDMYNSPEDIGLGLDLIYKPVSTAVGKLGKSTTSSLLGSQSKVRGGLFDQNLAYSTLWDSARSNRRKSLYDTYSEGMGKIRSGLGESLTSARDTWEDYLSGNLSNLTGLRDERREQEEIEFLESLPSGGDYYTSTEPIKEAWDYLSEADPEGQIPDSDDDGWEVFNYIKNLFGID